jgi:hypothetical protein
MEISSSSAVIPEPSECEASGIQHLHDSGTTFIRAAVVLGPRFRGDDDFGSVIITTAIDRLLAAGGGICRSKAANVPD